MKRILIVEEKHGTFYFDASTNELLHRACVYILKERLVIYQCDNNIDAHFFVDKVNG